MWVHLTDYLKEEEGEEEEEEEEDIIGLQAHWTEF